MNTEQANQRDVQIQQALTELKGMIVERYPGARFAVVPGVDDLEAIHLNATVDIVDTDEVIDLVIDRVLELQLEEKLPIHVVPLRPLARVVESMQTEAARRPHRSSGAVVTP